MIDSPGLCPAWCSLPEFRKTAKTEHGHISLNAFSFLLFFEPRTHFRKETAPASASSDITELVGAGEKARVLEQAAENSPRLST
jgi:hypothetical protein